MHFFLGFVLYEGISKIKYIIRIKRDNFNRVNANLLFLFSLGLKINGQVCLIFFNIKSIIKTRKLLLPSRFSILDILDNSDRLDVAIALKLSPKIMSN